MKSMATKPHCVSGTGSEWRGPISFVVVDLFYWQSADEGIYAVCKS